MPVITSLFNEEDLMNDASFNSKVTLNDQDEFSTTLNLKTEIKKISHSGKIEIGRR